MVDTRSPVPVEVGFSVNRPGNTVITVYGLVLEFDGSVRLGQDKSSTRSSPDTYQLLRRRISV